MFKPVNLWTGPYTHTQLVNLTVCCADSDGTVYLEDNRI